MIRSRFFSENTPTKKASTGNRFAALLALLLLCALATAGCQKQRQDLSYYHPHKPFSSWEEDLSHCKKSVSALKASDRLQQDTYAAGVEDCMKAKGYVYGYRPYPPPQNASYYGSGDRSYYLLDSTWHSKELAQKRADYLADTGIWGVVVKPWDSGSAGVWQQVLIGTFDTSNEASRERSTLVKSHGLKDLTVIAR